MKVALLTALLFVAACSPSSDGSPRNGLSDGATSLDGSTRDSSRSSDVQRFSDGPPIDTSPPAARIQIQPEQLDFGWNGPGTEGRILSHDIRITTLSDEAAHFTRISISRGVRDGGVFSYQRVVNLADPDEDGTPGLSLGQSFVLPVSFRSNGTGERSATNIVVESNDREALGAILTANHGPVISWFPDSLRFDTIEGVMTTKVVELRRGRDDDPPVVIRPNFQDVFDDDSGFEVIFDPPEAGEVPVDVHVTYSPLRSEEREDLELRIYSNGVNADPWATIPIRARAWPAELCPRLDPDKQEPKIVPPGVARLEAVPRGDLPLLEYRWEVIEAPPLARPRFHEMAGDPPDISDPPDDPTTPTVRFYADLGGAYVVRASAIDKLGLNTDLCAGFATFLVEATPVQRLHIELVWEGEADLDLHLRHPASVDWGDRLDCSERLPCDWSEDLDIEPQVHARSESEDFPEVMGMTSLLRTDGFGEPYRIGIEHVAGDQAAATLRVWLGRELITINENVELGPDDSIRADLGVVHDEEGARVVELR